MEKVALIDTGPIVALFDPRDQQHKACQAILSTVKQSLRTTVPVLTEAFHLFDPETPGARQLKEDAASLECVLARNHRLQNKK